MGAFPTEFLNKQESGSLPPHQLELKIGSPIIVIIQKADSYRNLKSGILRFY
jgi:hypothetical protein